MYLNFDGLNHLYLHLGLNYHYYQLIDDIDEVYDCTTVNHSLVNKKHLIEAFT